MMIRSAVLGSTMAFLVACGGKTQAPAGAAPSAAEAPAAPTAPAAPAAPPAKPIELTTKLDIGAAVSGQDKDNTSWNGVSIKAPEGAKIDASSGGTMVFITDQMSIGLGGEKDMAEKKQQAQAGALQKFVKFIVDEPNAFLWEAEGPNFLFVANVKLGEDKVKSCETSGYGTFTQQAAEKLLEACKGMAVTQ